MTVLHSSPVAGSLRFCLTHKEKNFVWRTHLRCSAESFGVLDLGCIHAFVGEAAAVRILVNLGGQSKCVASSQFCLCGLRVLDGEKALKGLMINTLFV